MEEAISKHTGYNFYIGFYVVCFIIIIVGKCTALYRIPYVIKFYCNSF